MSITKTLAVALGIALLITTLALGGAALLPGVVAAYKANVITTVSVAAANAAVSMMLFTVLMLQR